ncbi:hypothetical protein BJ944DRAFT_243847 [Cunninghamella echinulata]|nr:hypothetical protein BJ944DRAFT_243847 [Cunninghamella echinulata]
MENNYSKRLSSLSLDGGQRVISYSKGDDDDHKDSLSVYSDIGAEMDYRRYTLPSDMPTKMPSWMSSYNIPTPSASRSNSKSSKSSRSSIMSEDSMTPISPISYTPPPSIHPPHSSSVSSSHQRSSSLANVPHVNHPPPRTTSLNYNSFTDKTNDYNNAVNRSQSDPLHNKKNKTLLPMITRIKNTAEAHFGKSKYKPLDPPEPPKQLLIPSLCIEEEHHDNYALSSPAPCLQQQYKEKYNDDDDNNDNDDNDDDGEEKTINKNASSSTLKISTLASLSTDNNNNGGYTLRRRSSCPPKPIDQLKKGNETDSPSSPTPSMSSTCSLVSSLQQKRKKHRESYHSPSTSTSFTSSRPPTTLAMDMMWTSSSLPDQKPHPCDVYDHNKNIVLSFSKMNPRSVPLKRRTCGKNEKKALSIWHDSLVDLLKKEEHTKHNISNINHMTPDKREKYALTRKFILREIYLTEVTFWNQLYYTKVMFHDIMKTGIQRNSPFIRESDLDLMSNLPDLMQCSSKLIRKITPYLENPTCPETTKSYFNDQDILNGGNDSHSNNSNSNSKRDSNISQYSTTSTLSDYSTTSSPLSPTSTHSSTSSSKESSSSSLLPLHLNADARYLPVPSDRTLIGKHICDMAESFVVYLRCALDYKHNRKKVDNRLQHNKGFMHYQEQLAKSKETSQFFVTDYFIIPIQRITRYGLLLADLEKHTSRDHPDFKFIRRARLIMTSLAVAMNKAQK